MFPNRIDLGIGRAPGSDGVPAAALAYGNQMGIEYFPTKIADLTAFLAGQPPASEPFKNVRATPLAPSLPEVWLLGSSYQSAAYAAHFGLAYSFAHFIIVPRFEYSFDFATKSFLSILPEESSFSKTWCLAMSCSTFINGII